jgi:hypothetical protein
MSIGDCRSVAAVAAQASQPGVFAQKRGPWVPE